VPFDGKIREGAVYRLNRAPQQPAKYQYLVVSDKIEEPADVVAIRDFRRAKDKLKKKVKKGTGLEVTIAPARKMDAAGVGRWLEDVGELYSLCHSSRCQLILSSGASSTHEMVSGPCMDAILKNCGIDPERHWRELNSWLDARLARRVSV
jgi:hypothetical protein